MLKYDYNYLKYKIKTAFKTQKAFANAMGMSYHKLENRLNNKAGFGCDELDNIKKVLNLTSQEADKCFFTRSKSNEQM